MLHLLRIPSAELRPLVVEALLTLPSQALLLLCHLDDDLVITNKGSEVWDMSWRNHDKKTAGPLNKARPDMVTAITAVPSIL